jgi:hypothetical protein
MHVATLAFDRLAAHHGTTMERSFQKCAKYGFDKETAMAKARQSVRLAGLLHDIGHSPFSHSAEAAIDKNFDHEALSVRIVNGSDPGIKGLKSLLDTEFWDGCAETVGDLIARKLPPQLTLLTNLISGELDADRTDYLIRDSHHCGVEYGRFDFKRLIESLEICENEAGGMEMAIHESGVQTFEALVLARYQLSTQVLYHPVRRIYDHYLTEYHKALSDGCMDTPGKILKENDVTMLARIHEDYQTKDPRRYKWAKRIIERDHHRMIHGQGIRSLATDVSASQRTFEELKTTYRDLDFVLDRPEKPVRIHRIRKANLTRSEEEAFQPLDLPVISKNRQKKPMSKCSLILNTIPMDFDIARIYLDTKNLSHQQRSDFEREAQDIWLRNGGGQ